MLGCTPNKKGKDWEPLGWLIPEWSSRKVEYNNMKNLPSLFFVNPYESLYIINCLTEVLQSRFNLFLGKSKFFQLLMLISLMFCFFEKENIVLKLLKSFISFDSFFPKWDGKSNMTIVELGYNDFGPRNGCFKRIITFSRLYWTYFEVFLVFVR